MVAVFTGLGAGFERGSGAALGTRGFLGSSLLGRAGEGVFLNAATGNLVLTRQDEFLVGRGPDLSVARTYNSLGVADGDDNGDQWRQSTDRRIVATGTFNVVNHTVTRIAGDGSAITYKYGEWETGQFYYRATDGSGAHDKLTHAGNVWTWTDGSSRVSEVYEVSGAANTWRIAQQKDLDLNTVVFTYVSGSPFKLKSITTSATGVSELIEYTWGAGDTANHITEVVTKYDHDLNGGTALASMKRVTYAYDSSDRLAGVTVDLTPDNPGDSASYSVNYEYDGATDRITRISQTDGSELKISYDGSGRVQWLVQTVAGETDTRVTELVYNAGAGRTDVRVYQQQYDPFETPPQTPPSALTTSFYYEISDENNLNQLKRIVLPAATSGATAQEIQFSYDAAGNVTGVIEASGATTAYAYDASGNVTQVTDANGNVTTRTYDANNSMTRETRTGASSGASAGSLHARFVYDAENHLRFAISAEGEVTEYRYSAAGELSATVEFPDDAYSIGDSVPSLSTMNAWSLAVTNRTALREYVYDARGALTDVYAYGRTNGSQTSAQSEGYSRRTYVYDQAGQLRSSSTWPHQAETFVYDGLGRLTASTDLAGGTTTIVFNDASTTTTVTTASGYVSVSTFNKAGELISRSDVTTSDQFTNKGEATYVYDKNGQLRQSIDATNRKTFYFYDDAGRKVAEVRQGGVVVEYKYDANNRVVASVRYANTLSSPQVSALDADPLLDVEFGAVGFPRPAADNNLSGGADLWQWSVYDTGGRIVETILGDGAATSYTYDNADRLILTRSYVNKLDVSTFRTNPPSTAQTPTLDSADRITRSFFDRDGRLIGALNAEGFLSQFVYDGAGRKIQEIVYANATSQADRASGTFDVLKTSLASAKDASTRFVYDGQGLLRYQIDALNRVTEYVYRDGTNVYANGLVRKVVSYAAALQSVADYKFETIQTAVGVIALTSDTRVTHNVYNDRGQLAYTVDALGAVTGFTYDTLGQVIASTRYATVFAGAIGNDSAWKTNLDSWASSNGADARITRTYYNKRGDVRYVVDAEGYATGFHHDAEGRLTAEQRYATKISVTGATTLATVHSTDKGAAAATSYNYNAQGQVSEIYEAAGAVRQFVYLASGVKAAETAAHGTSDAATTYTEYDHAGRVIKVTLGYGQPEASVTQYVYDGLGNLTSVTDGRGKVTSLGYDRVGRLKTRTDAEGNLTTFDYDAFGRVVKTTDPRNNATYVYFDRLGRVELTIDAEGFAIETAYNDFGEVASVTRRFNQTQNATIDTRPTITANNDHDATTQYAYDKLGRVTQQTNALGGVVLNQFNAFGELVKNTDARGNASYFYYDKLGLLTLTIDAESYAIETSYNFQRLAWTVTRRALGVAGPISETTKPTPGTNAQDQTTTFLYDAAGRVTSKTDALAGVTSYAYDLRGNLKQTTNTLGGVTERTFDDLDRLTAETAWFGEHNNSSSATMAFEYDANGNVTKITNAVGGVTERAYDDINRLISEQVWFGAHLASASATTTYAYDDEENIVTITNALGGVTQRKLDALNRLIEETIWFGALNDPNVLSTITKFEYDGAGNLKQKIEAFGLDEQRTTAYEYDKLGRLKKITHDAIAAAHALTGSTQAVVELFFYNANGDLVEKRDPAGARTLYWYDKLGRVVQQIEASETESGGGQKGTLTKNSYDANGNVTMRQVFGELVTLPANPLVDAPPTAPSVYRSTVYVYDTLNRVTEIRTPGVRRASYSGGVLSVDASDVTLITTQTYDALGNVVAVTDARGFQTFSYFDKQGRKLAQVDAEKYRTDWIYDANGAVTSETRFATRVVGTPSLTNVPSTSADDRTTNFTNDKTGRRLTETRLNVKVFSAGAHVLTDSVITYSYNGLGQVATKTEATGDKITYSHDLAGRLIREARTTGALAYLYTDHTSVNVTPTVEYVYNGLNDLVQSKALGLVSGDDRVTTFTYGLGGLLLSKTDAAGFVRSYVYDAAGRTVREQYTRVSVSGPAADEAIGYDYDLRGRVVAKGVMVEDSGGVYQRSLAGIEGEANDTVYMRYNAYGELSERGLNDPTATTYTERFAYDNAGRLWKTNAGDGTWKYFMYDAAGNQTLMIQSTGADIRNEAAIGDVLALWTGGAGTIATTNVAGVAATITLYDNRGQAIEVREPQRQLNTTTSQTLTTTRAYTAFGEVAYEINAGGYRVDYSYNTMGRLIQTESPAVTIMLANYSQQTNYRPVEHRYYDASGRMVASRDGNGNLTQLTLLAGSGYGGSEALVTKVKTADSKEVITQYDIHGNARKITDQISRVTLQDFDKMGRLVHVAHPGGLDDYYTYDGLGLRLTHWNDFLGQSKAERIFYDQQGRIIKTIAMGGDPLSGQDASTGGDITTYVYYWRDDTQTNGMGESGGAATFGGWTKTTTYANGMTATQTTDAFNRAVGKVDMSGRQTTFKYDHAGRLIERAGRTAATVGDPDGDPLGETIYQVYFNTGKLAEIYQNTGSRPNRGGIEYFEYRGTTFGYDAVGNLVAQKLIEDIHHIYESSGHFDPETWDWIDTTPAPEDYIFTTSSATATYDGLGRITGWAEAGGGGWLPEASMPPANHTYYYDAAGNIIMTSSTYRKLDQYGALSSYVSAQVNKYRYDALNRMVGADSNGRLTDIYFDDAGQRAFTISSWLQGATTMYRREDYAYDEMGRVTSVKSVDGTSAPSAPGTLRAQFTYDAMGRLKLQKDYQANGTTVAYSREVTYNAKGQVTEDTSTTLSSHLFRSESTYNYGLIANGSYALGSVVSVQSRNTANGAQLKISSLVNTYQWWDGAVQNTTAYDPDINSTQGQSGSSGYSYDIIGGSVQLKTISIGDGRPRVVYFTNDSFGQTISRDEADQNLGPTGHYGDPHERWYRFGGRQQAYIGNNGTYDLDYAASIANRTAIQGAGPFMNGTGAGASYADFDQAYESVSSFTQGSTSGVYTVAAGDTLSSIAANLWGDASLWYKIAEVNGLSSDSALVEGLPLIIPTGVIRNTNNASTYQPYDPRDVIGNVSPTAPAPAKKGQSCSAAMAIIAIIAIVVVAVVAPYAAGFIQGLANGGGLASAHALGMTGIGGVLGTGTGFATGVISTGSMIAGGAIGGAVASVVSQGLAVGMGIQDKFSWNAVALAAISGGVAAGVGGVPTPAQASQAALRAVTSNLITQGIGVATGLQKEFSWAGVAAAGVSAAVGFKAAGYKLDANGNLIAADPFASLVARNGASMIANAATRSLIDGTDFGDNILAALPDVIGQTIGNAIAGRIAGNGGATGAGKSYSGSKQLALDPYVAMCQAQTNRRSTGFFQAIGDWLGMDGDFGYNGPTYGALSADNWGRAFTGAGAAASAAVGDVYDVTIVVTAPARQAWNDFWDGWNATPVLPYREATASASPAYIPVVSEWQYRQGHASYTASLADGMRGQRSIFNSRFENLGLDARAAMYNIESAFQRPAALLAPIDATFGRGIESIAPHYRTRYEASEALAGAASVMVGNPEALAASLGPRAVLGEYTTFYHGTSALNAESIIANGIALGRREMDFGPGFYVSQSADDAFASAVRKFEYDTVVMEFRVPNSELANLNTLTFESADASWTGFVRYNRLNGPAPNWMSAEPYDLVTGPYFGGVERSGAIRVLQPPRATPQTSVNTERAADLFYTYRYGVN